MECFIPMTWTPLRTSSNCSLIRIGPVTRQQGGPFHVVLCFSEDVFSTARPEHSELRLYHPLAVDSLLLERLLSWFSGRETKIHLYTDRSGARGILQRKGVGRLRHLSCRILWLQNLIGVGAIKLSAVSGSTNPADIGTKRLTANRLRSLMSLLGLYNMSTKTVEGSVDPGTHFHQEAERTCIG